MLKKGDLKKGDIVNCLDGSWSLMAEKIGYETVWSTQNSQPAMDYRKVFTVIETGLKVPVLERVCDTDAHDIMMTDGKDLYITSSKFLRKVMAYHPQIQKQLAYLEAVNLLTRTDGYFQALIEQVEADILSLREFINLKGVNNIHYIWNEAVNNYVRRLDDIKDRMPL